MSLELKKNAVQESYYCHKLGYCELQKELSPLTKAGYTCGVYGWNADIYTFENEAIVTGYRPFGERLSNKAIAEIKEAYETFTAEYDHHSYDNYITAKYAYMARVYSILKLETTGQL